MTRSASAAPGEFPVLIPALLVGTLLLVSSCGYHLAGAVKPLPDGMKSLGIPTFSNTTQSYRLEQILTRAVLMEFTSRTRARVTSSASDADAILYGEVRSVSSNPVSFGLDTFGSAFLVTVQASLRLVRRRDGKVLWENGDFSFRERYVLDPSVTEFFSEQNPALERLAQDLAASLASTILNQRP
jgi:outer membrane lipopolysaccharide assembly protein LptE/RlpB